MTSRRVFSAPRHGAGVGEPMTCSVRSRINAAPVSHRKDATMMPSSFHGESRSVPATEPSNQ